MVRTIQKEQFAQFVSQYQKLVFTVCLSFTKNYFDAEDLAQETFLTAFDRLHTFKGGDPKAWLTTIAANKCRDYLKSPARRTDSLTDEEMDCIVDARYTPEQRLIQKDASKAVDELCGRLKEPYRTVARSYFCDNVKLSELSRATGQNLKTLETQLYRAKKLLKALWEEEYA